VSSLDEFIGCTPDEVEQVRIAQKVDFLPKIYREFLLEMGRKASPLMPHHTYTYPRISEAKENLAEDAQREGWQVTLPVDGFIMSSRLGDDHYYFHTITKDETRWSMSIT
jgi:hypothetical protein